MASLARHSTIYPRTPSGHAPVISTAHIPFVLPFDEFRPTCALTVQCPQGVRPTGATCAACRLLLMSELPPTVPAHTVGHPLHCAVVCVRCPEYDIVQLVHVVARVNSCVARSLGGCADLLITLSVPTQTRYLTVPVSLCCRRSSYHGRPLLCVACGLRRRGCYLTTLRIMMLGRSAL